MSASRTDRGVSQMLDVAGVPLYRQIQADLRERINSGQLPPGSRLETEQELMVRYEVSRATVRQALAGLVNDGLVEIRRGLGTYVRKPAVEHHLGGFYSYSREIERHGMRPGTRVRSLHVEAAGQRVAAVLEIEPGDAVVALSRIRLADDEAIVTETSYLPADRFAGLEGLDFSRRSLYETLTAEFGVRPVRARESFEPVLMTKTEASELGGTAGSPALRVERTTYDADGRVIEYCRSTLRADRYHYSVELGDV
jgi:GntR family transcriptional regulator